MRSVVDTVPEIDTTVGSQSNYTKALAGGGSFQDVCGELTRVVQDRLVHSPPFIFNFLWGALWISMIIQEIKNRGENVKIKKKNSVQQTNDGEQLTRGATNQRRVC